MTPVSGLKEADLYSTADLDRTWWNTKFICLDLYDYQLFTDSNTGDTTSIAFA